MRKGFDFVMWDPRGVGLSGPTISGCVAPPDEPDLPATGPVDWETIWSEYAVAHGAALADCFAKNPDSAPYLGTWQVVRDLEAMGTALGFKRWNFWGMSYGTRIAYTYAKTFPSSIRSLIVDGSLWPQESVFRLASQTPAAAYKALQVYASVTERSQASKFEQVLQALDDTVMETPDRTINRWDVSETIVPAFRQQLNFPEIRSAIDALHEALITEPSDSSRAAAVRALEALSGPSEVDSLQGDDILEDYRFSFINCADLHDRMTPQVAARIAADAARNFGTTWALATINSVTCQGLPPDFSPGVPRDATMIRLRNAPVVVLSQGDLATPWNWGRTMANQYARSRTITYNSAQHVTYMQTPSTCVNDPVTDYVMTLRLPGRNVSCSYAPSESG